MLIAGLQAGMSMKDSALVTDIAYGFVSAGITGSKGMSGLILIAIQRRSMLGFIRDMTQGEFGRGIIGEWLRIFEIRG
jgi:hypothetical protein